MDGFPGSGLIQFLGHSSSPKMAQKVQKKTKMYNASFIIAESNLFENHVAEREFFTLPQQLEIF